MKFRELKIGNITLDIRVMNTWNGVYLAAYEPDHARNHQSGHLVKKVRIENTGNPENDFNLALDKLSAWLNDNAASNKTNIDPQRSVRSFYDAMRHICNYGHNDE